MKIHTSKSLQDQDNEFENFHYQLADGEKYLLTDGEADWLLIGQRVGMLLPTI